MGHVYRLVFIMIILAQVVPMWGPLRNGLRKEPATDFFSLTSSGIIHAFWRYDLFFIFFILLSLFFCVKLNCGIF